MHVLLPVLAIAGIGLAIAVLISFAGAALGILGYAIAGALRILSFASGQGFIGLAAYAACWFFLSPVMLAASVIVGWIPRSAAR
jgi:hypothetical protein